MGRKVVAVYSYDAAGGDELTIQEGDVIEVTMEDDEGWMEGSCNGQQGAFPTQYVEDYEEPAPPAAPPAPPAPPAPAGGGGGERTAVALYDYEAADSSELTIREGDVIYLDDTSDDVWWEGTCNGVSGAFPSNYVEEEAGAGAGDYQDDYGSPAPSSSRNNKGGSGSSAPTKGNAPKSKKAKKEVAIDRYCEVTEEFRWDPAHAPKIEMVVGNPNLVKGGLMSSDYKMYPVKLNLKNAPPVSAMRRDSHFEWLHQMLIKFHPGVLVPPLPSVKDAGRFVDDERDARRRQLEQWVYRITQHPVLRMGEVMTFFVSPGIDEKTWKQKKKYFEKSPKIGNYFFRTVKCEREPPSDIHDRVKQIRQFLPAWDKTAQSFVGATDTLLSRYEAVAAGNVDLCHAISKLCAVPNDDGKSEPQTQSRLYEPTFDAACKSFMDAKNRNMLALKNLVDRDHTSVIDGLREYHGIIASSSKVFKCFDNATKGSNKDTAAKEKFSAASYIALAEADHLQTERSADLKDLLGSFLKSQVTYHRETADSWRKVLEMLNKVKTGAL